MLSFSSLPLISLPMSGEVSDRKLRAFHENFEHLHAAVTQFGQDGIPQEWQSQRMKEISTE